LDLDFGVMVWSWSWSGIWIWGSIWNGGAVRVLVVRVGLLSGAKLFYRGSIKGELRFFRVKDVFFSEKK